MGRASIAVAGRIRWGIGATERRAGNVHLDVSNPDARHALTGKPDAADALAALKHGIVVLGYRTKVQHVAEKSLSTS